MTEARPHVFDQATDFCIHCGVPRYAVVDGMVIATCAQEVPSHNHGGPGVCRLCNPHLAVPTTSKQGELKL